MKKHSIIPIFIPHSGCGHSCIFCNQNKITAHSSKASIDDARKTIDTWLATLIKANVPMIEVAFYGGSFTGLDIGEQNAYLSLAKEYKDRGIIQKIHLSTRPDYIDDDILINLKNYGVDTIELGVQSFDDDVLVASKRGCTANDAIKASKLIKKYGFELGIQLMVGLPNDTIDKAIKSTQIAISLEPSLARIYPTIVLEDTMLYNLYKEGKYIPLSLDEAILQSKEIYKRLFDANITIMRVGLKASDNINTASIGPYHPAFRQLVESQILLDKIILELEKYDDISKSACTSLDQNPTIRSIKEKSKPFINIFSNPKWFSNLIGNNKSNKLFLQKKYPNVEFKFKIDKTLLDAEVKVILEQ